MRGKPLAKLYKLHGDILHLVIETTMVNGPRLWNFLNYLIIYLRVPNPLWNSASTARSQQIIWAITRSINVHVVSSSKLSNYLAFIQGRAKV